MRLFLPTLAVSLACLSVAQTTVQIPECGHTRRAKALFLRGLDPMGGGPSAQAATDTDVLHYNLDIDINPTAKTITGSNTITVKSNINGLTIFPLRLRSNFSVTSCQVNGVPSTYTQLSTTDAQVTLNRVYNAGEQFDVYIAYNGAPVSRGFGSIDFTTQNGVTLVETLSEPFYAYTWWPTKDDNSDKATADLKFTCPNAYKVVSNGLLISTTPVGGTKTKYYWKTDYQTATYLFCFAFTNYNVYSSTYNYSGGSMPVLIYIYPASDNATNRNSWFQCITMLGTFAPLFGEYPFVNEKYGIYQFNFSGGMEHQTITGEGGQAGYEYVTAHELGHQWWGDCVTCETWSDIWLNEGFASYSEALWAQYKTGGSESTLHSYMVGMRPSTVAGSVYCYTPTDINAIFDSDNSYNKAGWVLHMLRHVVGDTKFFQILALHRATHEYDSATTADFQATCELVYGSSLTWFFNTWVMGVGAPSYQYAWRTMNVAGQQYVELYINQNQSGSYPFFQMPIDVQTTISGSPRTDVVWNQVQAQYALYPVPGTPTALSLDPKPWILATGKSTVAFPEGPPKIVKIVPSARKSYQPSQVPTIQVTFHKNVNASAGAFHLVGTKTGSKAFTFSYNSTTFTATLTPTAPLPYDTYTLTVDDTITDVAASKKLDGELNAMGAMPSGNGVAAGSAVMTFLVTKYGTGSD